MRIITRKRLLEFVGNNPSASNPLDSWYRIIKHTKISNFAQLREIFPSADKVDNLTVEFSDFQLISMETNENMILVSLLNLNVNLGLIFIEIEEGVKNIKKILNK